MEEQVKVVNKNLKKLSKEEALKIQKEYYNAKNNPDRIKWNGECASNRDFFYNVQWQADNRLTKETEGRYLITLNRTKKYIEGQMGLLTADVPMIKVKPFGTEDNITSDIANAILSYIFNGTVGKVMLNRIVKFGLTDNISYAYVKQDKLNKTTFDCLFYDKVVPNPETTDPYFRDADAFYIDQFLNVDMVSAIYGIDKRELPTETPIDWSTNVDSEGFKKNLNEIFDTNKSYVKIVHIFRKKYEAVNVEQIVGGARVMVPTGDYKVRIKKQVLIGYSHLWEETLNEKISAHNIIPFYADDSPNVLKRGKLEDIKEQQMLLNASFGIMLYHAQMSSTARAFFWEDQIPNNDIATFKANINKIGSMNVLRGDGKDTAPPIFQQPTPLANAWVNLTTMMMSEMQFNMIPDQLMGMDSSQGNRQTEVYRNYELMLNSMRTLFTVYEGFFAVLGKSLLQYFFAYTNPENIYKVTSVDAMIKEIEKAAREGLDITQPETIQQWMAVKVEEIGANEYDLKRRVTDLEYKMKYINTLQEMIASTSWVDYDIVVEKGSYLPSHSMMRFFLKYELFKDGIVDNETVLEDAPIANRDQIKERISQLKLMQQENSELKGALKKYEQELAMLKDAVAKGEIDMIAKEHEFKADKQIAQVRAKDSANQKVSNIARRFETKEQLQKMDQELNETVLSLKYEIARAKLAKEKAMNDKGETKDRIDIEAIIQSALKKND